MNLLALADKLAAILKRDMLTAIRYRRGFLISGIGSLAQLAVFYYLSRAVGPGYRPEGLGYFPFLVVGTGFYTFLMMSINACLQTVQEAQQNGTLEVLMISSTPAPVLVLLSAISVLAGNAVQLLAYFAGGLLLFRSLPLNANLAAAGMIFFISVLIAISIGLVAAAVQIATQKGSAFLWLFGSAAWFMSGTLFPVAILPKPLHAISNAIPVTHALTGLRMALLQGASFGQLLPEISILLLFAFSLLPFSVLLFAFAVRHARQLGSLSFY